MLKRAAIYIISYLILVSLVLLLVDLKPMDRLLTGVVNKAGGPELSLDKRIVIINIQKQAGQNEGLSTTQFRQDIISLLDTITAKAQQHTVPKGIVLDIWFANDTTELSRLEKALAALQGLHIPVYAVYNINEKHEYLPIEQIDFDEIEARHAFEVYNQYLAGSSGKAAGSGRYHTFFYPDKNVITYENNIYLKSTLFDSVLIESLAWKAYADFTDSKAMPPRQGSVIPIRPVEEMAANTWAFGRHGAGSGMIFQNLQSPAIPIDMNRRIVIAGNTDDDLIDLGTKKIPGPYVLAWALSDLLGNNSMVHLPVENIFVIIGQLLFFSLFAVFGFALIFTYVKRWQTKPGLIALLSFTAAALLLFIYGQLLLHFHTVIPVSHALVGIFIACLLAWRFAHRFLVSGIAEGSNKYDVFISYSRNETDWVEKNVFQPLTALRKPNGDKLNIFYDKKSIGLGEAFTARYMWAIVDARHFIAVLSEDYYQKNHCKNELDCAVKRKVEKLTTLHMVAFSAKAVPEAFNGFNYVLKDDQTDFIELIKDELMR